MDQSMRRLHRKVTIAKLWMPKRDRDHRVLDRVYCAGEADLSVCQSVVVCRWRAEHGGMEVSQAHRFKELEPQNARLKKAVAN